MPMDTKSAVKWTILLTAASILGMPGLSCAQEAHIGKLIGQAEAGKQNYRRFCAGCHGVRGDAQGENAPYISPQPRNFTQATFKCRSTPTGTLPTDQDLFKAMTRGFNTTNMPQWISLTNQQRADLVAYIKTFSNRWNIEQSGTQISIPPEPAVTIQNIQHGRDLYQKMECWKCHGAEGRGDGPSAPTLTDSNDRPILPYDFSAGERFKCGTTNEDLYRIFMTGLDGTPMPSFADVMQPNDAWDLVHYLRTLQRNRKGPEQNILKASGVELAPIKGSLGEVK
jgi:mono/diheme cytochrome c family protein